MKAIIKSGARLLDGYYRITAYAGGLILGGVMLMIGAEVAGRYFFGFAIPAVTDVSGYALFITTFLVAAWVLKDGGHVTVDIVVTRLRGRARRVADTLSLVVSAAICGFLTFVTATSVWDALSRGDVIGFPLVIPRGGLWLVLPVGCFFLTVQFLVLAWARVTLKETEAASEAAAEPVGLA